MTTTFTGLSPASGDARGAGAHAKLKSNGCDLLRYSYGCVIGNIGYPTPPPGSVMPSVPVISSIAIGTDMQRDDGYQIGDITVQGVRAYDPITAQWTTPDAYKGDVDDPMSQKAITNPGGGYVSTYDTRSGQLEGQEIYDCTPNLGAGCRSSYTDTRTLTYDNAGRQTQTTAVNCTGTPNASASPMVIVPAGSIETRSFDAENHLVSRTVDVDSSPSPQPTMLCPHEDNSDFTLTWGLDGHPWTDTDDTGVDPPNSLHWDGDTLLYTSTPFSDNADSLVLHIGKLGVVGIHPVYSGAPYGITTYDRDWSGFALQIHGPTYFSALTPATGDPAPIGSRSPKFKSVGCNLFRDAVGCVSGNGGSGPAPTGSTLTGSGAMIDMVRDDGYQVEDVTIQGVRAYDPITSQWITPDAYKGDVDDPMSQKPYMWNNNNPVTYADPSGYCPPYAAVAAEEAWNLIAAAAALTAETIIIWKKENSSNHPEPQAAPAPEASGNTNPYKGPVTQPVTAVDSNGNAIPVKEGERIDSSPNGDYQQVKDRNGVLNGIRYDRGGHQNNPDPDAKGPHGHAPGATTSDGNPHVPLKKIIMANR